MKRDALWLAGQKMLAGFEGTEVTDELREAVHRYKIGNIVLFERNSVSTAQTRALCEALRAFIEAETGLPPLIAVDQEGGVVSRLSAESAITPSAMALGATGSVENTRAAGRIVGRELAALGINLNLAPVLDVNSNVRNPIIGARSFGDDPALVSAHGAAMIDGIQESGVLACAKHFPGHGDTAVDSHLGLPRIEKTLPELEACELIPFRAAIAAGVKAVMTSHILFPNLDGYDGLPATLSRRVITGLLREALGYDGLIISDCLMMDAIAQHYGTAPGAVAASRAGVDMICVSHAPSLAGACCEAIRQSMPAEALEASVQRIVALKRQLPALTDVSVVGCPEHRAAVRRLREESLTRLGAAMPSLGDKPLFVGCRPYQASQASNPRDRDASFPAWMRERFGGTALETSADPDAAEIARASAQARESSCVVLGTCNGHLRPGQLALMCALGETERPLICVALHDPYDLAALPDHACGLAAYEYSRDSLEAVARALRGELQPQGRLSVRLEARA